MRGTLDSLRHPGPFSMPLTCPERSSRTRPIIELSPNGRFSKSILRVNALYSLDEGSRGICCAGLPVKCSDRVQPDRCRPPIEIEAVCANRPGQSVFHSQCLDIAK